MVTSDGLYLKMSGRKLYEYALTHVPDLVAKSLDRAGVKLADVKKVLIHQANAKMDEAIVLRLFRLYDAGAPDTDSVMPMSISWLGNSSVATVPTLLDLVRKGRMDGHELNPGDIVLANIVVLTLGILASLSPAWRASRYEPMEAIRKV